MKRKHASELRVGVFVLIAVVIATMLIFVIGSQRNLFQSKTTYHAVFHDVAGLRPGSPIMIAGVNVGTVRKVSIGDDSRIHVDVDVVDKAGKLIRHGSVASIGNKGLLGDKEVDISVGEGAPLPAGSTIPSSEGVSLEHYASEAGAVLHEAQRLVHNLSKASEPLGEAQFSSDLRTTAHNLAVLSTMATQGDGTLQHLMTDRAMAAKVDQTLDHLQSTSAELDRTARSVRGIANEVQRGHGSMHQLIYGPDAARLAAHLSDASGEVAELLHDVRTGQGTAHQLIYGGSANQLVQNLTQASDDIRYITGEIRAGRGTLGGLITDPSIYEDVKRLVGDLSRNQILRALVRYSIRRDEARPNADVTSSSNP